MGADMLLYCCEDPRDYAKAHEYAIYRIDQLDDEYLESLAEEHLWYETQEIEDNFEDYQIKEGDLYSLDDLMRKEVVKMAKEKLLESVEELIGSPKNGDPNLTYRRDVASLILKDTAFLFSGGMSWGDQPSEACDHINLVDAAGLFDGMGSIEFDYESFRA